LPVIGAMPATFATSLKFLESRELPDAQIASITSSCANDRKYNVPAGTTTAQNLKAFVANCVYTFNAGGRYELFFGGTRVAGPFNANTGIDILPGTYELVTSFSTADGPETERETITF
jgi:hypothetical protein